MDTNPYKAPAHETLAVGSGVDLVRRIKGPSTGLIVLLAFQVIGYIAAGLIFVASLAFRLRVVGPSTVELFLAGAHLLIMIFMLRSLVQIRRLQQLRNGRIAAGIACVPFLSPLIWIGIPFGVWLSVVLAQPATAEAFRTAPPDAG